MEGLIVISFLAFVPWIVVYFLLKRFVHAHEEMAAAILSLSRTYRDVRDYPVR